MEQRIHTPSPEIKKSDEEVWPALADAAEEYIAAADPKREHFKWITDGDIVAFLTVVLANGSYSVADLKTFLKDEGFVAESTAFRTANLKQVLEVAEHVLWAAGVNVAHEETVEGTRTRYSLVATTYEPGFQALVSMLGSTEPLAEDPDFVKTIYADVFGANFTSLLGKKTTQSYAGMARRLASDFHVPEFVAKNIIDKAVHAGIVSLHTEGRYPIVVSHAMASSGPHVSITETAAPSPVRPRTGRGWRLDANRDNESVERAWAENLYRELALVVMRRMFWNTARNGVPMSAMLEWLNHERVTDAHKAQVITTLHTYGAITTVESENGPMLMLTDEFKNMSWHAAEPTVGTWFNTSEATATAYVL